MRSALPLLLAACALPEVPPFDEGDGEPIPVEVIAGGVEDDYAVEGGPCADGLCCRFARVDVAYTQAELDGVFEGLFGRALRAPEVDLGTTSLALVASNHACDGVARQYLDEGAVHDGPDLVWSLSMINGDFGDRGLKRSYLVGVVERRRYRSVLPDLDVVFSGGEPD